MLKIYVIEAKLSKNAPFYDRLTVYFVVRFVREGKKCSYPLRWFKKIKYNACIRVKLLCCCFINIRDIIIRFSVKAEENFRHSAK